MQSPTQVFDMFPASGGLIAKSFVEHNLQKDQNCLSTLFIFINII